jgi:hypothetical protein
MRPLDAFNQALETLTFQERLGVGTGQGASA